MRVTAKSDWDHRGTVSLSGVVGVRITLSSTESDCRPPVIDVTFQANLHFEVGRKRGCVWG